MTPEERLLSPPSPADKPRGTPFVSNPRSAPRVLRTVVAETQRQNDGPIWTPEEDRRANIASPDDPEIVKERNALREKLKAAGVSPPPKGKP